MLQRPQNTEGMFSKLVEEASRHQTGMKVTASQEDIARIVAEEADKVRRLSLERQASVDE